MTYSLGDLPLKIVIPTESHLGSLEPEEERSRY